MKIFIILCSLCFGLSAQAGDHTFVTLKARATIPCAPFVESELSGLSAYAMSDLNFGKIRAGSPTHIIISPSGRDAARIEIDGQALASYAVDVPSDNARVVLKNQNGAKLYLSQFTAKTTWHLDRWGRGIARVGSTLTINSSKQECGNYSGEFVVAVTYL